MLLKKTNKTKQNKTSDLLQTIIIIISFYFQNKKTFTYFSDNEENEKNEKQNKQTSMFVQTFDTRNR